MPHILGKHQQELDETTDGEMLASFSPYFAKAMKSIKAERDFYEANHGRAKGIATGREMQKIARVPSVVFDYLTLANGMEWMYSKEFMKWLDRHPEYKVGRTLISGVDVR
jgi:hypothetical protein